MIGATIGMCKSCSEENARKMTFTALAQKRRVLDICISWLRNLFSLKTVRDDTSTEKPERSSPSGETARIVQLTGDR